MPEYESNRTERPDMKTNTYDKEVYSFSQTELYLLHVLSNYNNTADENDKWLLRFWPSCWSTRKSKNCISIH